jgi:hypothetical protein
MILSRTRKITWIDPLSKNTLTFATFPIHASAATKREILARCRQQVRLVHGDAAAESVRLSQ